MLTPYHITIKERDTTTLPVIKVVTDKKRTFYFIEGVCNNVPYRGAATLYESGSTKIINARLRTVYALKIEIRSKHSFYETRYIIYYEK